MHARTGKEGNAVLTASAMKYAQPYHLQHQVPRSLCATPFVAHVDRHSLVTTPSSGVSAHSPAVAVDLYCSVSVLQGAMQSSSRSAALNKEQLQHANNMVSASAIAGHHTKKGQQCTC